MTFSMTRPCKKCGAMHGSITTKNGQDCVYCGECGTHVYNAPKTETGRAVRSVKTTHDAISTSQRYRIIERDSARCVLCGCRDNLHVSHVISVEAGHRNGLSDAEINSDENLIAACEECNLGMSSRPMPLRILVQLLKARYELEISQEVLFRDQPIKDSRRVAQ